MGLRGQVFYLSPISLVPFYTACPIRTAITSSSTSCFVLQKQCFHANASEVNAYLCRDEGNDKYPYTHNHRFDHLEVNHLEIIGFVFVCLPVTWQIIKNAWHITPMAQCEEMSTKMVVSEAYCHLLIRVGGTNWSVFQLEVVIYNVVYPCIARSFVYLISPPPVHLIIFPTWAEAEDPHERDAPPYAWIVYHQNQLWMVVVLFCCHAQPSCSSTECGKAPS